MRRAIILPALLLAACNNAGEWENEQANLANELNATEPAAEVSAGDTNVIATDTDYINETAPAANDVNVTQPVENQAAPPPES